MPLDASIPRVTFDADYWSLRFVDRLATTWTVRKNVALPPSIVRDRGVMATVYAGGGLGYSATLDLSVQGIDGALQRARAWAIASWSP